MPGFNHKKSFNFPLNGEDESILRIVFKANEETALGPWVHTVATGNNLHLPNILQQKREVKSDAFKFGDYVDEELSFLWSEVVETHGDFWGHFFGADEQPMVVFLFLCVCVLRNVWFIAGSVQVW